MTFPITEHVAKSPRHTSFYLACGPEDGPLIVFVHGWPELSISWRHQLRCFGALGFRAVAPDMRGYGRSSVYPRHEDYTMEAIAGDLLELLAHLGRRSAMWVGHDWGSEAVWSLARHHPECFDGLASLCVPYAPGGFTVSELLQHVDRELYPPDRYPAGQWDYVLFYEENFEKARATFDANPLNTVKALFRKGDPAGRGKPARTAAVRRNGGWFGAATEVPDLPVDRDLLSDEDLHQYASALARNGFFGPDSWYMNSPANLAYARAAAKGGAQLSMPVLFMHAAHDYICDTVGSTLAEPMRRACSDLSELTLPTGHWMAQERPELVNAGLARWLAQRLPGAWYQG
jgi:pimeloyl-ACP methyl ester carboxylesterase